MTAHTATADPVSPDLDYDADPEVREACAALEHAVDMICHLPTGDGEVSLAAYAAAHKTITESRSSLAKALDGIVAAAADLPHDQRTLIDGVGVVEFHYRSNRTNWDDQAVLAAVWDEACADPATGEVTDRADPQRLLSLLTDAASLSWRVTKLREQVPDLDIDEARTIKRGPLAMRVIC